MLPRSALYDGYHFCCGHFLIEAFATYPQDGNSSNICFSYYTFLEDDTLVYLTAFPWNGDGVTRASIAGMLTASNVPDCLQTLYAIDYIYDCINECILTAGSDIQRDLVPDITVYFDTYVVHTVDHAVVNLTNVGAFYDIDVGEIDFPPDWELVPDYVPIPQPASIEAMKSLDVGFFFLESAGDSCIMS